MAFGGTVTSSGGVLTQTASKNGLSLSAKFTSVGSAIKVDATVTDTTGADRAFELSYRLPLDIAGWIWDDDFVTPMTIASGTRYENLDKYFGIQTKGHTHSVYPFATVRNAAASFSLAVPMGPLMYRFSYDDFDGFRITYDLGLSTATTKSPSKATVSFWIYTQDPKWGMRSAVAKYYALNPASFTTSASTLGAWVLASTRPISSVPDWQDFGWAYHEQDNELDFDNANGILALHYVNSAAWGRDFSQYAGQPQPPYSTLIAGLESELNSTGLTEDGVPASKMAQSVLDTAPHDENGRHRLDYNSFFWKPRGLQNYPMLPDPDIPGSRYGIVKQYSVDHRVSSAKGSGNPLDGIFLDNMGLTYANVENYRKSLWAYLNTPLSFSYATRRPTAYSGDAMAKFCVALRSYLHGKGLVLMGSSSSVSYSWFANVLDVVGGEAQGADPIDKAYIRRALSYGKPWTNLFVPIKDTGPPTAPEVLAYLRQALLLGYFPGFTGAYWANPSSYERDRGLFQQYIPLIRTVAAAGWRPVHGVTTSQPMIYVERFDDERGDVLYLTAQNGADTTRAFQLTLDAAALRIEDGSVTVTELLSGRTLSASRIPRDVRFSDTLAPGETVVYRVEAPRPGPPARGPTRRVEPRI